MARPIIGNYFEGKICKKCGTTIRYTRGGACVQCTQERNARKSIKQTTATESKPKYPPRVAHLSAKISSAEDLRRAADIYYTTQGAIVRSNYLNQKVRQRFAKVLGETEPSKPQPMTAGELHRASLPVGAQLWSDAPDYQGAEAVAERHAQDDAIADAIKRALPTLPDLVTLPDIISALPSEVITPLSEGRLTMAFGIALKRLGIQGRETPARKGGGKRMYIVRDPAGEYAAMRQIELTRAYIAMVNDRKRVQRPAAAARESLKSEVRSQTPGRRDVAQRPFTGQMEQVAR